MKVGEYEIAVGATVTAEVVWRDGRRTRTSGSLNMVHGNKAYIKTLYGSVEVDINTVEPEK